MLTVSRRAAVFLLLCGGAALSLSALAATDAVALDLSTVLNGAAVALLAWNFRQVAALSARMAVVEALQRERNTMLELIHETLDKLTQNR